MQTKKKKHKPVVGLLWVPSEFLIQPRLGCQLLPIRSLYINDCHGKLRRFKSEGEKLMKVIF